jgi:hypothetical protein
VVEELIALYIQELSSVFSLHVRRIKNVLENLPSQNTQA